MNFRNTIYCMVILLFGVVSIQGKSLQSFKTAPRVDFFKAEKSGVVHVEGELSASVALGNEISASYNFFDEHKSTLALVNPVEELSVENLNHDRNGMVHVKFRQTYHGVPVITGQLFTHFNRENKIKTVNGTLVKDIAVDPTPIVSSSEAVNFASDDLQSFFGDGTANEAELVIFPWEGEIFLSWRMFILTDYPMGRWEYFVDAHTGEIIFKANRIMNTEAIGTGIGVMGNAYDHIDTDFDGSTYRLIDYTRQLNNNIHGHNGQMSNGAIIRTYITTNSLPGSVGTDLDNVWVSSPAAVDGQLYSGLFYDWLLAELGRNSFNGNGATMNTTVDYIAEGTNNAYWNGNQIVVWGASGGRNSLAGSPDVIAHEWGHAVTQYTSDLIYQKESGALNESFSDMMGSAFEFAHPEYDAPDWKMGENFSSSGNGIRNGANPHLFGDPDTYGEIDQYWIDVVNCTPTNNNDWCGVHTNSGVGNKWFFLLSDGGVHNGVVVEGIGVENAIKVAYHANEFYWTTNSTYEEAAFGTISAANDLDSTYMWTIQVHKAWEAVGIDAPNPEIGFTVDSFWGWVPFSTNFQGSSVLNVQSWDWDFGDGTIANVQSPIHTFSTPGTFDVSLQINADGDVKTLNQSKFIIALADTISIAPIEAEAGQSIVVTVRIRNNYPLNRIFIPIEYGGMFTLTPDSVSTVGCRTEYFDIQKYDQYDGWNKRFAYRLENNPANETPDLPIGEGDILKVYFTVGNTVTPGDSVILSLDGYLSYTAEFEGEVLTYDAVFESGKVLIPNCFIRGDATNDGAIDISDLVLMVEYSFNAGPAPSPLDLGDVNCSGSIDISDIVLMVEFMFNNGPPPCGC